MLRVQRRFVEAGLAETLAGTPSHRNYPRRLEDPRNAATGGIDWQFTTADACTKLKRLYPAFDA